MRACAYACEREIYYCMKRGGAECGCQDNSIRHVVFIIISVQSFAQKMYD